MKKYLLMLVALCSTITSYSFGKSFGDWTVHDGGKYRFAEQYAAQEDLLRKTETLAQRIDFTFYPARNQWEMTLTTSLLADMKDLIVLTIDGEKYIFTGKGCCHKQTFDLDTEAIESLKQASKIVVEEFYRDEATSRVTNHFKTEFSSKGSYAAILWVEVTKN